MPCHQYRYNRVWMRVKKWLREGAIGRWHLAELSVHRLAADPGRATGGGGGGAPWRGAPAARPGGVVPHPRPPPPFPLLDLAGAPAPAGALARAPRPPGADL